MAEQPITFDEARRRLANDHRPLERSDVPQLTRAFGIAIREALAPLEAQVKALEQRLADAEQRSAQLKYVGVWRDDGTYHVGNFVSHGGSMWHCEIDAPTSQPGLDASWRLAVKHGRDGKNVRPIAVTSS